MYSTVTVFEIYIEVVIYKVFFLLDKSCTGTKSHNPREFGQCLVLPDRLFLCRKSPGAGGGPQRVIRHTGR